MNTPAPGAISAKTPLVALSAANLSNTAATHISVTLIDDPSRSVDVVKQKLAASGAQLFVRVSTIAASTIGWTALYISDDDLEVMCRWPCGLEEVVVARSPPSNACPQEVRNTNYRYSYDLAWEKCETCIFLKTYVHTYLKVRYQCTENQFIARGLMEETTLDNMAKAAGIVLATPVQTWNSFCDYDTNNKTVMAALACDYVTRSPRLDRILLEDIKLNRKHRLLSYLTLNHPLRPQ